MPLFSELFHSKVDDALIIGFSDNFYTKTKKNVILDNTSLKLLIS
jgi:hypothetical protein